MAKQVKQQQQDVKELSLIDIFDNAGIENEEYIEYADKVELAGKEVVFTVSEVEEVESNINKSGKQWQLTISYDVQGKNGETVTLTEYLTHDHNPQRNKKIQAIKDFLDKNPRSVVVGCTLKAYPMRHRDGVRYDIEVADQS